MFCCLNWIHFMDETEDSIDIKVNYKRKVDYSPLIKKRLPTHPGWKPYLSILILS